jgi:hypothetical protein
LFPRYWGLFFFGETVQNQRKELFMAEGNVPEKSTPKTIEMRIAELEDKLAKVHITEDEMKAFQKVAALTGGGAAGVPQSGPAQCVINQCIQPCIIHPHCVVNQCIINQCIIRQCIIRQCIIQNCFECGGGCAPGGGIASGGGFGGLGG